MNVVFNARLLTSKDIEDIIYARIMQETDLGLSLTEEYINSYRKVLLSLFDSNKVIGAGVYKN